MLIPSRRAAREGDRRGAHQQSAVEGLLALQAAQARRERRRETQGLRRDPLAWSTDVWGLTTTNTYDSAGRVDTSTGPGGVTDLDYDNAGRLTAYKLDTVTLATPTYRPDNAALDPGILEGVAYSNGTSGAFSYDPVGMLTGIVWTGPGGTISSDTVTRSLSGKVLTDTVDGSLAWTYSYDAAGPIGRLAALTRRTDAAGGSEILITSPPSWARSRAVSRAVSSAPVGGRWSRLWVPQQEQSVDALPVRSRSRRDHRAFHEGLPADDPYRVGHPLTAADCPVCPDLLCGCWYSGCCMDHPDS